MSLHGLAEMTLGVPNVDATKQFYREFGLAESTAVACSPRPTAAISCASSNRRTAV